MQRKTSVNLPTEQQTQRDYAQNRYKITTFFSITQIYMKENDGVTLFYLIIRYLLHCN